METKSLELINRLFKYLLLSAAILYVAVYLFIAISRIRYPFVLEWIEGGMLSQVKRILAGEKLYVKPSLDFITFIYAPLYFYVSALFAKIFGAGFATMRLVSLLSSLGCFSVIYLFVRRETGSIFPAILASCLFSATFLIGGSWFDIAKSDSLFLFLLLISLYFLRFGTSSKSYVLAGIFISLSFLTKQTALVIFLPLALYCIYYNWRYAILFIVTTAILIGGSNLLLNHIHDGWYYYYVFDLPGQRPDPFLKEMYLGFWLEDLMTPLPVACVMAVFYLILQFFNQKKNNFVFYLLTATAMIGSSYIVRLHDGGYNNVLFPAYALISILFGLAVHALFELIRSTDKKPLIEVFFLLLCIMQFSLLKYNPFSQLPSQKDAEAGRSVVSTISRIEGEVFIPCCDYLSAMAGKRIYAHLVPADDIILKGAEGQIKNELIEELIRPIREKKFSAIIIDSHPWTFTDILEKYYVKKQALIEDKTAFFPVTGMKTRPEFIYVPKE